MLYNYSSLTAKFIWTGQVDESIFTKHVKLKSSRICATTHIFIPKIMSVFKGTPNAL